MPLMFSNPFKEPDGAAITDEQIKASDTDTAVYVIAKEIPVKALTAVWAEATRFTEAELEHIKNWLLPISIQLYC